MAEEASDTSTSKPNVELSSTKKHHKQTSLSYNRPKYRESRWERAVKVYTINLESKYVLVQGVPAVGAVKELLELFALYGAIQEYRILDDYPTEPFTEVYWIKFDRINSARVAKKKLDNRSFFGGILHVCYAPEFETVDDTREKLQERRKVMAKKTRELFGGQQKTSLTKVSPPAELSLKRPIEEHKSITASTLENQRLQANGGLPNHTKETPPGSLYQPANSTEYTLPSSSPYDYPTLLPPPQHFYPFQYPPPPPPWDLPRVPSSHATLPACMQILLPTPPPPPAPAPPPPPPPPLPPTESSVCDDSKTSERSAQGKPCTVYMTQVMIGPQREQGASSNKASLTGDDSLDKTAISIRNRMRQLTRTHEDSTFPTQNIQVVQNPAGSAVSSVPKKKRKRI